MTMDTDRKIPAGEFKARCLAFLDEVADTGHPIVITKRGKPVARLVPTVEADPHAWFRAAVVHEGDILSPVLEPLDID